MPDQEIGHKIWAIPEGYIPGWSTGPAPEMTSHEALCILNASDGDAHIEVTIFFADKEPAGPYKFTVPARRTRHFRFNEFKDPPIPIATSYSSVVASDVPVVVQYTRLDSRQAENSIFSTMAYAGDK